MVPLGDTFYELFLPVGDILSCFSVCLVCCLKSEPFLGLRSLLPGGLSMAAYCLVTSLGTVLCCACRCCRVIHYDSPPRLLEPPWRAPLIREPFAAPSAFTLCLVSQFLNLSPALDVSPIASPDGLGTSPASWTSPSPSPAFPFDPFHPSPSSQEAPLLLQRFSALGSLGSLQMSIPRTPGGRENQGFSGQQ